MKILKKLIYMCAAVLTTVLSVGCSQSDNNDAPDAPDFEEGIPTEVRITLSARSGNQTRADGEEKKPDGDPKDPTASVELIHNWWIAFINKKGEVKIIKRTDVPESDRTTSTSVNIGDGFEAESFKIILPSGKYRIYAFANIPSMSETEFKGKLSSNQLVGKHINDFVTDAFNNNSNSKNNGMQWCSDVNIPMTKAMSNKEIKNTMEEAFNIEVIRVVAKVEFAFSKTSTDVITLKKLEFSPITNDVNVSFAPNDDVLGYDPNNDLIGKTTGTLTFSNISLTDPTEEYNMGKFSFYCKESIPKENGGPFTIKLTVNKKPAGSDESVLGENVERTLYTKKITYINRNDWVLIPIKFSDWIIYWKLHYYPPIGGYPPVFDQNADGSSMKATLTTGGEFELYPVKIVQNSDPNTDYSSKVDWDNNGMKVEVLSGENLFVKAPAIVDNTNVSGHPLYNTSFPKIIMGELDEKQTGVAEIKISFYLSDSKFTGTIFTCNFTITRKNSSPTK